jgi:hypothetical protein
MIQEYYDDDDKNNYEFERIITFITHDQWKFLVPP